MLTQARALYESTSDSPYIWKEKAFGQVVAEAAPELKGPKTLISVGDSGAPAPPPANHA